MYKNYFAIIFLVFYVILTFFLTVLDKITPSFSLIAIAAAAAIFFIFKGKVIRVSQQYKGRMDSTLERINLADEELKKKDSAVKELPERTKRIFSIKDITQKFVDLTDPDIVCRMLVTELNVIFPEADNILLFLFPPGKDRLMLRESIRRKKEVIKEKKGDVLDWWVLKNNQSLLIENIADDYRFDFTQVVSFKERGIHSIIASPISIGTTMMGLVRLESREKGLYTLEDSRVLRVVCDLGAAVLERARLFSRTRELAIKDSLTDLFLRSYFLERFEEELKRTAFRNAPFGLVILDVDDFKKINDTYGHTVGDKVLKKVSAILKTNVGDSGNVICRLGGEEFIFLMVECGKQTIQRVAEKIRKDIAKMSITFRRKTIQCTVSMGLVMYPEDGADYQQLFVAADKLLYQAKHEGKNRICST